MKSAQSFTLNLDWMAANLNTKFFYDSLICIPIFSTVTKEFSDYLVTVFHATLNLIQLGKLFNSLCVPLYPS